MPTESFKRILDRDESKEIAKPVIEIASPVLQEAVNWATNLYERCRNTTKASTDEAFPVFSLYLHIIQMIDSIEVLISNSCVEPAQLLLRSAFEAKLGLEFIVEKMQITRARAWVIRNILDLIEFGKQHNSAYDKGEKFSRTFEKEGFGHFTNILPSPPDITDEFFQDLKAVLEKPDYSGIYQEYKRLAKKHRHIEWYSLYDGPTNLRELAEYLNQKTLYDTLYRQWSKISHVANPDHLTLSLENGERVLGRPIRNPMNMPHVSNNALGMLFEASQLMIKQYLSGDTKKFVRWWNNEIKKSQTTLHKLEIDHLDWFNKTYIDKNLKSGQKPE